MATLSPASRPAAEAWYRKRLWQVVFAVAIVLAGLGFWFVSAHWPFRYSKVKPMLEDDLAGQVEIASYHRIYFPHPGFVARGLTLRRRPAVGLPPLGHIQLMVVRSHWSDLLLLRRRVESVEITGMHIVLPRIGSKANRASFPPGSSSDFTGPSTAIEMFKIYNSIFEIAGSDGKRLVFPVRELNLAHFEKGKAINYALDMENAIPSGHVQSRGTFGPLNTKEIGNTPVSGRFTYASVNLHDLGNIAGTMFATGGFHGTLGAVEAHADSITPNFAVGDGRPTRVAGSIDCTINGLTGGVMFRAIDLHTGATRIHARGSVQGSPKATNLDIEVKDGRAEDVMRPFIHEEVPIIGPVSLHSHAYLAPVGEGGFLRRLHMAGAFNVPSERVTNQKTEKSLTDFSHRAESKKDVRENPSAQGNDVFSSLEGPVRIEDGIASSKHLAFRTVGAEANLSGTFNFHTEVVHLVGNLRMDTDISHTATGFKAFLLKIVAPFFRTKRSAALVPIAVTGGPGHYHVAQDLSHTK